MGLIHEIMPRVRDEIGAIGKDGRNQAQSYRFRSIDHVLNVAGPVLAKHNIGTSVTCSDYQRDSFTEKKPNGADRLVFRASLLYSLNFHAADGSTITCTTAGEGMDYGGDKASNKAMSTAHKYAILQILNIPTAAIDNDQGRQKQSENIYAEWVRTAAGSLGETDDPDRITKLWNAIIGHKPPPTDGERAYLKECRDSAMARAQTEVPA